VNSNISNDNLNANAANVNVNAGSHAKVDVRSRANAVNAYYNSGDEGSHSNDSDGRSGSNLREKRTSFANEILIYMVILFFLGSILAELILLLQNHFQVYAQGLPWISRVSLPVIWGIGAVVMGTLYPIVDCLVVGVVKEVDRGWPDIFRCVVFYIGINYAATKFEVGNGELAIMLSVVTVGQWWIFDRTLRGFLVGLLIAILGSFFVSVFVYSDFYRFSKPDFFVIQSYIPVVLFSAGTCYGTVGRHIAPHSLASIRFF